MVLVALVLLARTFLAEDTPAEFDSQSSQQYKAERVVDGDTLVLEGGHRVRLIGVDTPETKHPNRSVEPLGPEATKFMQQRVEGRMVALKFDRERRDRYRRILAFVYIDGQLLNEELVRKGYGRAMLNYPYSRQMKKRLAEAEQEARDAKRGIWGLTPERER
ncbi:MAG: thermonuclease family protein [Myxococcota bacterium]